MNRARRILHSAAGVLFPGPVPQADVRGCRRSRSCERSHIPRR
jgi:hypothetical protein